LKLNKIIENQNKKNIDLVSDDDIN